MMLLFYYMRASYAVLFSITLPLSGQGLKCWHCVNQRSNRECIQNGQLIECAPSQNQCQNELRFIANSRYLRITKGCKQGRGCDTQMRQNELLSDSYNCQSAGVTDACWCCCSTDNCNRQSIHCLDTQLRCEELSPLENGFIRCQNEKSLIGTKCFYRCYKDFHLVGEAKTTCLPTTSGAEWSSKTPVCEPVTCQEAIPPIGGSVSCDKGNSIDSICRFTCDAGYKLIGASFVTCGQYAGHFRTWSDKPPFCLRVVCKRLPSRVPHLEAECTNGNRLGSICRYFCASPRELDGNSEITCTSEDGFTFGKWSGRVPTCSEPTVCRFPRETPDLIVSCTNESYIGSFCEISCPSDMVMVIDSTAIPDQVVETACTKNGWAGDIPDCRPLICPAMSTIENGEVGCTNENNLESVCEFRCRSGFRLDGDDTTTCMREEESARASWTNAPPNCARAEADELTATLCANYRKVSNGYLSCQPPRNGNGTHWITGTKCQLQCTGDLYSPIGELSAVTCTPEGWVGQVCCDECLSTPRLDIIALLDSSNADEEKWELSKSFIHDLILYMVQTFRYKFNIYIVPYSSTVDSRSRVKVPNIRLENYEEMFSYTQSIPYVGSGASNTGLALRYVNDEIVGQLQQGSIPLVFVVTNRWPNDISLAAYEAQRMRESRIHIRVVALTGVRTANPGSNILAFEAITGGEPNSVVTSESMETFYVDATIGIDRYEKYCEDRIPFC